MTTVDLTPAVRAGVIATHRGAPVAVLRSDRPSAMPFGVDLRSVYSMRALIAWTVVAIVVGVLSAGLWNARVVDGFGRDVVAGNTVGAINGLGSTFETNGFGWGFVFAWVAGLAATFTACNCVVYAALGIFSAAVIAVGAFFGIFVGLLGPTGVAAFNQSPVRLAQARTVFSGIGLVMLVWGVLEFGYLKSVVRRFSPITRAFFASPHTKAAIMGVLVGLFAVGRPYPVFREFLTYAATASSPLYGAAVMAVQGVGQIAVMVAVFMLLVYGLGNRLNRWVTETPHRPALVSAVALVTGGTYFIYYWGLAFAFDIGRWGFKLGWYS
jgi:hypothetical protein